jgi:FMN phosphatase YigB (HAD superfamily)
MKAETFYTLPALLARARRLAADCDTVSFDLFDTLLLRRVHEPGLVKAAVARAVAARAREAGLPWSGPKVLRLRDAVVKAHRDRTGQTHADREARYPEYMTEVLGRVFGADRAAALLPEITDYELALEQALIVPRADLVAWLRELHAAGKRLLVLSDIYLPSDHLRRLIGAAGFLDVLDDVYSSADTFLAKASGRAFLHLRDRHGLDVGRWLHVGDNPISDGWQPATLGVRALVLRDVSERTRQTLARRYAAYGAGRPFWRGRALQQLMLPLEAENGPRPPRYVEGYNFFAPLVGAFIQRIAERTRELGIRRAYFLSREGWTFLRFWEQAVPLLCPAGPLPDARYLHASRLAFAGAACAHQGLTPDAATIAFLPPGNRDFRDLCRVFGLDPAPFQPLIARAGLRSDTPLSIVHATAETPAARLKLTELLEDPDFQAEVRRQTRPVSDAVQRYLEQQGFFDHPDVAVVDIGWLGTIQRFLYDAVRHRPDRPRLHGFLLGAVRGIPYPTTPDNYVEGVLYDRDRFDLAGGVLMYARDVFEEAFRAPHPGVNGYQEVGGEMVPVFREAGDAAGLAEARQNERAAPLQQGILDAAPRFAAAAAVLGYTSTDLKPWINHLLVSRLAFPRTREVALLRHEHHLDDFYGPHAPPARFVRACRHLWDHSPAALRWNPLLRPWFYARHIAGALRR